MRTTSSFEQSVRAIKIKTTLAQQESNKTSHPCASGPNRETHALEKKGWEEIAGNENSAGSRVRMNMPKQSWSVKGNGLQHMQK